MTMQKLLGNILVKAFLLLALFSTTFAQDWIKTGTGLGVEKIRIAVPEFKASNQDPRNTELLKPFNDTLCNDQSNAGISEMVSRGFYSVGEIGAPVEVTFDVWSAQRPSDAVPVLGNLRAGANR